MERRNEDSILIVDVNKFDDFRYSIAKICFLEAYQNRYSLIADLPGTNCIKVKVEKDNVGYDREKKDSVIIASLLRAPTDNSLLNGEISVIVFKQKTSIYIDDRKKIEIFSEEFNFRFEYSFRLAIQNSAEYYKSLSNSEKILLRHCIVNEYFEEDDICYKYFSQNSILNDRYNLLNGKISFADPNLFNDPFDVNCHFSNGIDISNLFRVFCVAPKNNEILMWSYYGDNHKGFCLEYRKNDILNAISNIPFQGICLVGKVKYSDNRPQQRSRINQISYTELKFYINAAFTKYKKWEHEEEYRFVMLSYGNPWSSSYIQGDAWVYNIFEGCKSSAVHPNFTSIPMRKHSLDYKLFY